MGKSGKKKKSGFGQNAYVERSEMLNHESTSDFSGFSDLRPSQTYYFVLNELSLDLSGFSDLRPSQTYYCVLNELSLAILISF
jgi:hypothetical protein